MTAFSRACPVAVFCMLVVAAAPAGGQDFRGRIAGFNALNSGTVVNFSTVTGPNFQSVIGILDPRIFRFGVRYDF
jgi:hypothetical protein